MYSKSLLINAFYVAAEFALTRLRQYDREELEDHAGLKRAWEMTETLEIYLTSCQIGITTTSILLGVIAEPAVTELIGLLFTADTIGSISSHTVSIILSITLINLVHTIWGEQAPTYLGVERAKTVAKYAAFPLYWWTYAIYPILLFGDRITKATLRLFGIEIGRSWLNEQSTSGSGDIHSQMVDLLKTKGVSGDRREEVLNALDIDNIPVKEIMIPRQEIISLSTENTIRENIDVIIRHMHARYPLVGTTLDDVKGILYTPQITANMEPLLRGEKELDDFDWPRMIVPQDLPVSKLIDQFQVEHQELALIKDDGRITGLVTLTDALETIIGSAEDPLDLLND
ncbi:Hemolysin, contains CBS domains [Fodinibius roseus]|uniref:Hemolysin, contains CBS domains n=1 Tax=Fodinibius roseus TaxID=1194090 RepID=A0A1M4T2U4_9BACT|nr:hemolysin family protein [Fodinibius roseus]SHE38750.1 Hemolysin, contains CBS domains [Fodinibius roseus]